MSTLTTPTVTASVTSGPGPYSYYWYKASGSGSIVSGFPNTANRRRFQDTGEIPFPESAPTTHIGNFVCRVTTPYQVAHFPIQARWSWTDGTPGSGGTGPGGTN